MVKLDCNSREGIIDFIERSQTLPIVRNYYSSLIIEVAFEKSLKEISNLRQETNSDYLIIYWQNPNLQKAFLRHLNNHLNQTGIQANIQEQKSDQKTESIENLDHVLLLLFKKKDPPEHPQDLERSNSIDLSESTNYYFSVFEILKKLLPNVKLEHILTNFKKYAEGLESFSGEEKDRDYGEESEVGKPNDRILYKSIQIFLKRKWNFVSIFLILSLPSAGFLAFKIKNQLGPNLLQEHSVNKKSEVLIRSDLAIPTESTFLQRAELLSQVDETFKKQEGIQTLAIVGVGGAGKTTLARLYAQHQETNVMWEVNAETHESLKSSFENLAQAFAKTENDIKVLKVLQSIKDPETREARIILFVKQHLSIHPNWFLIFDNVEKFTDIKKYFPQDPATWGNGRVILTTRDNNIQNNTHVNYVVQIGELNTNQKLALFIKIMNHGNTDSLIPIQIEQVKTFLEYIPPFPLDVSIAGYYLKATHASYDSYLKNLAQCNKDFATVQESLLKEAGDYTRTRYGIIILSLQNIINVHKDFRDLLLFISLLDSQNIPKDLLDKFKDKTIIDNFIYNLKKHSLITNEFSVSFHSVPSFSIHRSTQAIALAYLENLMNSEKNKHSIEHIGTTFKNYAVEAIDKEDFPKMNLLIRHCEMFLSHPNLLTNFVIASIDSELGNIYRNIGNYEKARQLLEESIIIYKKSSNETHPWHARALAWLGSVYRELGNYDKAKQYLEEAVVIYRKNSFETHPWFARTLQLLGSVYEELGNYVKVKQLLEESIVIYKKNSYENHPWFARALQLLGNAHRAGGNYKKAKQLFEQSIVIYKNNSYENLPWFTLSLAGLGKVYRDLGNYENAKKLLEESITIYKRNSFKNNLLLAQILGTLGSVYREQGNYEKAKQLLEESIVIYKLHSYVNHPWFAGSLAWLGNVYRELGYHEKAKQLLEESIVIYRQHSYEDHPWFAWSLENLGSVYSELGNFEKAKQLLEESLIIYRKNSFENHPWFARALSCLGNTYRRLGDFTKAKGLLTLSLQTYEKIYGRENVNTAPTLMNLGLVHMSEGDMKGANDLMDKALEIFQRNKHLEEYVCLESLSELSLKKAEQGIKNEQLQESVRFRQQAIHYLKQALEIVKANFNKDSPHILRLETKLKELSRVRLSSLSLYNLSYKNL